MSQNFKIKKRNNQWANEVFMATDSRELNLLPYGDRFIPRRLLMCNMERNLKFTNKGNSEDAFLTRFSLLQLRQYCFSLAINQCFDIKDRRILNFCDEKTSNSSTFLNKNSKEYINGRSNCNDWSCKPRAKPSAYTVATHDLPGFDFSSDVHLVDWSINDQIVATFGRDLIIWKRREDLTLIFKIKCCKAISYCPNGDFLAIGCKNGNDPTLEIWNIKHLREVVVVNKKYFHQKHVNILCIEWNKSGKELVCGTNHGTIIVLSVPELNILHKIQKHRLPIVIVKFSPTMRYLACGDGDGNVSIFNCNTYNVNCHVKSCRKRKISLDWHPWNGVELAMSHETPATVAILHVPTIEVVAYYSRKDKDITIDTITFSKLTGELLVSVSEHDIDGCISSKIIVLSSFDRVVDVLRIPESGARFLMWSPDGTQLASAGEDETLTFWNFYSEKGIKKSNKLKLRCRDIKQMFGVAFGLQFNMWSSLK